MALANERIAAMSNLNSEQYKEAQRQQEAWSQVGTDLRKDRLELQGRMADQEMDTISQAVERMNTADRQRAEFRADVRGSQPDAAVGQDNRVEAEGWRPVGPEEILQPGAHVRMDMQTGQAQVSGEPNSASQTAPEAVETHEARGAASGAGQAERPVSEAERPAEMIQLEPTRPERETEAARENTDAHQPESNIAANLDVTDAKAAKKAAIMQARGEIEASIGQGQDRGYARGAASADGQAERPEAERPAEAGYGRAAEPERENTDARQLESNIAANLEVTDAKAAKKAAITQARGEIEASIAEGQDRGGGHSR